jgi:hypothetical protein
MLVLVLAACTGWFGGAGVEARGQARSVTGTGFLAGQVVENSSGTGVGGATVTLIGNGPAGRGGSPMQVIADSQGRFFFSDLLAGTFRVQVVKAGYSALSPGSISRTIDLADGERIIDIKSRVVKLAGLSGTVRDDGGDPVVGAGVVALIRSVTNGRPALQLASQGRTDDRGAYHVWNLRPGDYVVCACLRDPIPFDGLLLTTLAADPLQLMGVAARALKVGGDVASVDPSLRTFAPTFYPNSLTTTRATRITLGSGEDKAGVDIDVTGARSTRVSGTIVGAIGPVQAPYIRLAPAGEVDAPPELVGLTPMLAQADGRFDFSGVPPGQYVLRMTHPPTDSRTGGGPSGSALMLLGSGRAGAATVLANARQLSNEAPQWAAEPITVGDNGVSGLTIVLKRASGLSGLVQFVGAAEQPAPQMMQRGTIVPQLVTASPGTGVPLNNAGPINADGSFHVPGMLPGRYSLSAFGAPGWPTLKSITIGGVDFTDLPVEMEASEINDVIVTFTDTPMATVSGTLAAGSGPSRDMSVVVFPTNRKYWADPAAGRRLFRESHRFVHARPIAGGRVLHRLCAG